MRAYVTLVLLAILTACADEAGGPSHQYAATKPAVSHSPL